MDSKEEVYEDGEESEVDHGQNGKKQAIENESSDEEDSSEDDDSEDDMDMDTTELEAEVEELEKRIQSDSYDYEAHCSIIRAYRRLGDLEKLTIARHRMLLSYPLSPEMWLQWLRDEQKYMDGGEDRVRVKALFEAALRDYVHVDVWLEFCSFMIGGLATFGEDAVRATYEDSLSWCGSHFTKGHLLWASFRELEMVFLMNAQVANDADGQKEQMQRIDSLFRRQLKTPLQDLESVWAEYKEWKAEEAVDAAVEQDYLKALEKVKELKYFEDKLESLGEKGEEESERVQVFLTYLSHEVKGNNMNTILGLFERAICEHCLDPQIWTKYTDFMESKFPFGNKLLPLYYRAIRNVSSCVHLWIQYGLATERFEDDPSVVKNVYEQALLAGVTEMEDVLLVWMNYLSATRRLFLRSKDNKYLAERMRSLFKEADEQITQAFGKQGDPQCMLQQFWALFEARDMNDVEKARLVWTEIMKRDQGNKADMWLRHVDFELRFGDAKHVMKVLSRAVNSVTDDAERVFQRYLQFVEQEGDSLDPVMEARKKVAAQSRRLAERNVAALEKQIVTHPKKGKTVSSPTNQGGGKKRGASEAAVSGPSSKVAKVEPPHEQRQVDADGFAKPQLPVSKKLAPPAAAVTPAESHGTHVQHDPSKDSVTVFVSNLDFNLNEEQLRNVFEKCGAIAEIRLVRNYRGASKGFGYVQFHEQSSVTSALQLDRTLMPQSGKKEAGGRPMFVTSCNPQSRHQFEFSTGLERHKLFVKHVARSVDQEELRALFAQFGTVKDLRIPTFRNGQRKECAFIEFSNADEASRALVKLDGHELHGQMLMVQLSNPPSRNEQGPAPKSLTFKSRTAPTPVDRDSKDSKETLGAGSHLTTTHGHARTLVDLVPRNVGRPGIGKSVVKRPNVTQNTDGDAQQVASHSRKSNEEFRKMFLKSEPS